MGWAEVWAGSPRCHPPGSGGDGSTLKGSLWGLTKGNGALGPPSPPWHGSACTQQRCAARRGCPLCPWAPREVPPSSCLAESFGQPPIPKKGGKQPWAVFFHQSPPRTRQGGRFPLGAVPIEPPGPGSLRLLLLLSRHPSGSSPSTPAPRAGRGSAQPSFGADFPSAQSRGYVCAAEEVREGSADRIGALKRGSMPLFGPVKAAFLLLHICVSQRPCGCGRGAVPLRGVNQPFVAPLRSLAGAGNGAKLEKAPSLFFLPFLFTAACRCCT